MKLFIFTHTLTRGLTATSAILDNSSGAGPKVSRYFRDALLMARIDPSLVGSSVGFKKDLSKT